MNEKTLPVSAARLEEIIAEYPTPFHIYDAKGIVDNIRRFIKAFSWAKDFKLCRKSDTESIYYAFIAEGRGRCGLLFVSRTYSV